MNTKEAYLIMLMEECSEVIKECSKIIRFGENDREEGSHYANKEKLSIELDDLHVAITNVEKAYSLDLGCTTRMILKREKIEKYFKYSKDKGTLTD